MGLPALPFSARDFSFADTMCARVLRCWGGFEGPSCDTRGFFLAWEGRDREGFGTAL